MSEKIKFSGLSEIILEVTYEISVITYPSGVAKDVYLNNH